jgi:hypothetical protein
MAAPPGCDAAGTHASRPRSGHGLSDRADTPQVNHCSSRPTLPAVLSAFALLLIASTVATAQGADFAADGATGPARETCRVWRFPTLPRDPTPAEIRCRYGIEGPGRFGLSLFQDVPVYQPVTPLPGTHVVGVPGMPRPWPGESYEEWEWRILRTDFGREALRTYRGLEVLDPLFASRLMEFEARLQAAGVRFTRRETWRSPYRQAYLFQQGRARPGPLVTATLTSWHTLVDEQGTPSARAADYNVPRFQMAAFHEIAWSAGLETYGPESNDPGHVYLSHPEPLTGDDLAFLRLLPRVPHVTLATGRPTDEFVGREERAAFRLASAAFASEPFLPYPRIQLAEAYRAATPRVEPITPLPTPGLEIQRQREVGLLTPLFRWLGGRGR